MPEIPVAKMIAFPLRVMLLIALFPFAPAAREIPLLTL